jgi:hypothetical protein
MLKIEEIFDKDFDIQIKNIDMSFDYLKTQFNIELKSYGNFLRLVLNNIQPDSLNNLIERVNLNRELESALCNSGGYSTDILKETNSKVRLNEIINYLQTNPLKFSKLINFLNIDKERKTIIADINDIDFLNQLIRNHRIKIISFAQLKKNIYAYTNLIFYSFNGKKDFDFIYNLQTSVSLVLYSQEHELYKSQLQKHKYLIEQEVGSKDRKSICGISYEPIPDFPIHISQTIENIVNRIDNFSEREYDNYREESDLLLDELLEKCLFKISFANRKVEYLDSNETVYSSIGTLLKIHLTQIKIGDKIRIYPKEHFANNLYQVAVETDKNVFGKVEEHSKYWMSILEELKKIHTYSLYTKLKANGLRVLPATVESYNNAHRKFPMYTNDLKAIIKLKYPEKDKTEIDMLLAPIRKSKSTYNSTMIALGRGIKQEIKLFLQEKQLGEILTKLKFTETTLQTFINEYMPLQTITGKEVYKDASEQLELTFTHQLEL